MKLITERSEIQSVAARWAVQYQGFRWKNHPDKQRIAEELAALDGETATADDVAAIIGNRSWTELSCDECGESVKTVVQLGQEPDYESNTVEICVPCLESACALARSTPATQESGDA